jgi:hypothetical protein
MKSVIQFLCAFALAAFTSVIHARDLSKLDPFCDYVGKTVELRRPMSVVETSNSKLFFLPERGVVVKGHADRGLAEVGQEGETKIFGTLPVGHLIRIARVSEETHFDSGNIIAYGRTKLPSSEKEITFAYVWATGWTLHPAPWEPDETPPIRPAGIKLPPHFDYDTFKGPKDAPKWGVRGKSQPTPFSEPADHKPASNLARISPITASNHVPDAPRVPDAPTIPDKKW